MPVHMEWIESPSEQDWVDLNKLYKEAPAHWFDQPGSATTGDAKTYIDAKTRASYQLLAGRFNDRLISAAALKPSGKNSFEIEDLCVRQVTQERGVAKQLLVRICQWADESQNVLKVRDEADEYGILAQFGFMRQNEYWLRNVQG